MLGLRTLALFFGGRGKGHKHSNHIPECCSWCLARRLPCHGFPDCNSYCSGGVLPWPVFLLEGRECLVSLVVLVQSNSPKFEWIWMWKKDDVFQKQGYVIPLLSDLFVLFFLYTLEELGPTKEGDTWKNKDEKADGCAIPAVISTVRGIRCAFLFHSTPSNGPSLY